MTNIDEVLHEILNENEEFYYSLLNEGDEYAEYEAKEALACRLMELLIELKKNNKLTDKITKKVLHAYEYEEVIE